MNNKSILLIACLAWTASHYASDAQKQLAAFNHVAQLVNKSPNIFEDRATLDAIKRRISDTDSWLKTALKKYKSDSLEKIRVRATSVVNHINAELNRFGSDLGVMKRDVEKLKQYRIAAQSFSKNRDALKEELRPLGSFKLMRVSSDNADDQAKVEIADVLNAYVETFIAIAQKAITDFARIDAALFKQEKTPKPAVKPGTGSITKEARNPFLQEESRVKSGSVNGMDVYSDVPDRESGTWADWDSE